eukprot:scaffold129588_cov54-Phaeocystis_antarctica.AAC.1
MQCTCSAHACPSAPSRSLPAVRRSSSSRSRPRSRRIAPRVRRRNPAARGEAARWGAGCTGWQPGPRTARPSA